MGNGLRLLLDASRRVLVPIVVPEGAVWVGTAGDQAHFQVPNEVRERVVLLPMPEMCRCRIDRRELDTGEGPFDLYWLVADERGKFVARVTISSDGFEWYAVVEPVPISMLKDTGEG